MKAHTWNRLPFWDEGVSSNHAVLPDNRVIQDSSSYPNERVVVNRAAMQHGLVADRHTRPQREGHSLVRVKDSAILHIRSFPDGDRLLIVTSDDRPEPNAGLLFHDHVAYL